jgi:hypothetical protein
MRRSRPKILFAPGGCVQDARDAGEKISEELGRDEDRADWEAVEMRKRWREPGKHSVLQRAKRGARPSGSINLLSMRTPISRPSANLAARRRRLLRLPSWGRGGGPGR